MQQIVSRSARRTIVDHAALLSTLALAAVLAACGGGSDDDQPSAAQSQLYTATNESANAVVHFTRKADGTLVRAESTSTGGAGTNAVGADGTTAPDSLASQHSLIVDASGRTLFVVNGGDDSVSVFAIDPSSGTLRLKKRSATPAGHIPNSLAHNNGVLYTTFIAGNAHLAAYRVQDDGSLTQLATYDLATLCHLTGAVAPTQVVVSPDAKSVVVNAGTGANAVMSFSIQADGTLAAPTTNTTQFPTPFAGGFVTAGPAAGNYLATSISGVSLASYSYSSSGMLAALSHAAAAGVAAPCWLSVTPDGKFAYVGNGSGAITSYALGAAGSVTLLASSAAQEPPAITGVGSVAADSWISPDGKFLYTAYLGDDKVVAYSIGADGSLTKLGENVIGTATHLSLQGVVGL
jgi:6-phosphogluconolactonase